MKRSAAGTKDQLAFVVGIVNSIFYLATSGNSSGAHTGNLNRAVIASLYVSVRNTFYFAALIEINIF